MRLLVLSFYYTPDIGPGALRAASLVDAIKARDTNVLVDVITTLPNRYNSLDIDAPEYEVDGNVTISRTNLPAHKSGMLDQSLAFIKFFLHTVKKTYGQEYDIVAATSGRLLTAALAALIAKKCNAKLYLDIRDLFSDTIKDILKNSPAKIMIPIFRLIENLAFKSAQRINVVSEAFVTHLDELSLNCEISTLTNGIDDVFKDYDFRKNAFSDKPVILYAGNIGQGQGLEKIIPQSASALSGRFRFLIIGDGGRRQALEQKASREFFSDLVIQNPVTRDELMAKYKKSDILFLHLNDFEAFQRVLPSKIFEYAATGKPILAGVGGYASEFLSKHVIGAFIFKPNDIEDMEDSLEKLLLGPSFYDRSDFVAKYMRGAIMEKMANDILSL